MTTRSINVEVVAGGADHPYKWDIQREDWSFACSFYDNAALKDCTAGNLRAGRNTLRIGGSRGHTAWAPAPVDKNTLDANRKHIF